MRKHILAAFMAVTVFALTAGVASTALATPTRTTACLNSSCHVANAAVTISATPGTAGATTTQYTISAANSAGAVGWAVFDAAGKKAGAAGSGATVALNNGTAYTVYAAGIDGSSNTIGKSTSFTVPVPDTTAPTTTSDAKASYVNSAVVHLTATDNLGGSGVSHTYYILDGAPQVEGATISTSVLATHTLQFWSVDAKNNAETPKSVQFNVHAPIPDITAPTTISDVKALYYGSATINLTATDNVDGSGVAHTYYILDGGSQLEGTTITTSILGTHTVDYWSVDASNNIETPHNTANFTVAVNPAPVMCKYTYKFKTKNKLYKKLKAILRDSVTGQKYTVSVPKKGVAKWMKVPAGQYRLSTTGNKHFKFKTRTVKLGA